MKKLSTILLILFFAISAQSQTTWEKLIANTSSDVFRSVQEVPAGGYVAAGIVSDSTANDSDAYVMRFDINGDTLWTFRYNGPLSQKDVLYKINCTTDGGFIACGYSNSVTGTSDDMMYMKLNSSGQLQWVKYLGGSNKERAQDIIETVDGYTLTGYTTSSPAQYYDAYLVHVNFSGDTLWTKVIGDVNYDDANSLKQLPDGGYILGGQSNNGASGLDLFLVRTNSSGNTIWTKRFGTAMTDNIESLILVSDGFVMAGSTNDALSGDNGYLVKTDTAGNLVWSNTFGGNYPDDFHRVEQTSDGGFILSGTSSSHPSMEPNMWLVKTNPTGNQVWASFPGGFNHDHGYSGVQTSDNGYIIVGHTGSFGFNNEDAYVVKLDANGALPNLLTYFTVFDFIAPICSSPASQVMITLRNFGNEVHANIPVTVEVSGAITQTLNATYVGAMFPGDFDSLVFSPPINTSGGGTFTFTCTSNLNNDVFPANNTLVKTVTLLPCTGIDEIKNSLGFTLLPNPANEYVSISFLENHSTALVELISMTGSVIYSDIVKHTAGKNINLNLAGLPGGIYLVKAYANEFYGTRRLIVE